MNKLIKIREFDAHGGPSQKTQGAGDKYAATPTTAGRYVIQTIEKHISADRYSLYSGIPWGAGLKLINNVFYVDVRNDGRWVKLTSLIPKWIQKYKTEDEVTAQILTYWRRLSFTTVGGNPVWLYGIDKPNRWLFSDFGHISVKYYVDKNHNFQLDKGERIMGDFIHTTPNNEAASFFNNNHNVSTLQFQVKLSESHGCIHVKPNDVETMIGANYLKKGRVLVVHSYSDTMVMPTLNPDQYTRPGYEVHFFPGLYKIVVYKVT